MTRTSRSTQARAAIRAGILAARKDAPLYGITTPHGYESKAAFSDNPLDRNSKHYSTAFRRERYLAINRYLATLSDDERRTRDLLHQENEMVRLSKTPSTTRDLIEIKKRLAVLENTGATE